MHIRWIQHSSQAKTHPLSISWQQASSIVSHQSIYVTWQQTSSEITAQSLPIKWTQETSEISSYAIPIRWQQMASNSTQSTALAMQWIQARSFASHTNLAFRWIQNGRVHNHSKMYTHMPLEANQVALCGYRVETNSRHLCWMPIQAKQILYVRVQLRTNSNHMCGYHISANQVALSSYQRQLRTDSNHICEILGSEQVEVSNKFYTHLPITTHQIALSSYQRQLRTDSNHMCEILGAEQIKVSSQFYTCLPIATNEIALSSYQRQLRTNSNHTCEMLGSEHIKVSSQFYTCLPITNHQIALNSYQRQLRTDSNHMCEMLSSEQIEASSKLYTRLPITTNQIALSSYQRQLRTDSNHMCEILGAEQIEISDKLYTRLPIITHQIALSSYQRQLRTNSNHMCEMLGSEQIEASSKLYTRLPIATHQTALSNYQQQFRTNGKHMCSMHQERASSRHLCAMVNYNTFKTNSTHMCSMLDPVTVVLSNDCYILHNAKRLMIADISLHTDENSYAWSGAIQLANLPDYALLKIDDEIQVFLQDTEFKLLITNKGWSKRELSAPQMQIDVISITAKLMRHKVSKTWGLTTAKAICEELAGQAIDWQILNWTIYAGEASCVDAYPMAYIRQIASTVDGIVQTQPDGQLLVVYRCAKTPKQLNTTEPDKVLTASHHLLSIIEQPVIDGAFNVVWVGNGQQSTRPEYQHEYDPITNQLKIWANPWVNPEQIQILHTGHANVQIGTPAIRVIDTTEYAIEFKQGVAQINYPLHRLNSVTWRYADLGTPVWGQSSKDLQTLEGNGYSLADISYQYKVIEYPIQNMLETTQFLVIEED